MNDNQTTPQTKGENHTIEFIYNERDRVVGHKDSRTGVKYYGNYQPQ